MGPSQTGQSFTQSPNRGEYALCPKMGKSILLSFGPKRVSIQRHDFGIIETGPTEPVAVLLWAT